VLPYLLPCPNNRPVASWLVAGLVAQQIRLLGSSGILIAARLWAMLGAKGQAEHTGCCCGALSLLTQHIGALQRSPEERHWLRSVRRCDNNTKDLTCQHL